MLHRKLFALPQKKRYVPRGCAVHKANVLLAYIYATIIPCLVPGPLHTSSCYTAAAAAAAFGERGNQELPFHTIRLMNELHSILKSQSHQWDGPPAHTFIGQLDYIEARRLSARLSFATTSTHTRG